MNLILQYQPRKECPTPEKYRQAQNTRYFHCFLESYSEHFNTVEAT